MNRKLLFTALLISLGFAFFSANAAEQNDNHELQIKLQRFFEGASIQVTDYNADLKQIVVGVEHFFASNDGRYVFTGAVLDTQRKTNLSAERDAKIRQGILAQQPTNLFVNYPSKAEQKHQITIFTDIDCPYCRQLHLSIDELNKRGVSVRYAMMPRQGEGSQTYVKTANALCSSNAAESIDSAMRGQTLTAMNCDSTQLSEQLTLARRLNINSTPTLVLPSGELQIGLRNTDQIVQLLEQKSTTSTPNRGA